MPDGACNQHIMTSYICIYLCIYLYITNCTELSPYREATSFPHTQDLPSILWNPEVHYRVHESPPPVPILSQTKSVHTTPSYLSKIHPNIIHICLGLSSNLFPSGFPINSVQVFFSLFLLHALYIS
jgi:hypothetical protein